MTWHVQHAETGAPGVARARRRRYLTEPGPWWLVEFDDGLTCWVPEPLLLARNVSFS